MKRLTIGILAHVDAGKTTLSESFLYLSGQIRKLGRVDHQDAFLDYDQQERHRGITIYSKQAIFKWKDTEMTLVDTPGHADFSTEMERTLQILDYAILVINGMDGVQAHTKTIWNLLEYYHVPTFIFVNKMDLTPITQEELYKNIQEHLNSACMKIQEDDEFYENLALVDEDILNYYLEHQTVSQGMIQNAIFNRQIFPVVFGSALKNQGIDELLDVLDIYTKEPDYSDDFGAKVFKITHDQQGNQLTHMKITGGSLKVKEKIGEEKVDQIRLYSGTKYEMINEARAGMICTIKGLQKVKVGDVLGKEVSMKQPLLSSYMNYRIVLPENCDQHTMLKNLQQLALEDPDLHISYHQQTQDIHIQLMGEIQIEILKNLIKERFDVDVLFDQGQILYKETITNIVEGVGHYEPLRHYSEVHILLEPLPAGSGLKFESRCSEDVLSRNWQRLIMTHMQEKEHLGVLIGAPITDMKLTLVAGKAHQKHTEGGDFRQATYRAIRQGLKKANSILLEPYFYFELTVPQSSLSRALYDIEEMNGKFEVGDMLHDHVVIRGEAPAANMQNYQSEVIAYTKGQGKLLCTLKGYQPCHNQQEVIEKINYDSEADLDHPTGSIFCSHGAGFYVAWDEVEDHMHLAYAFQPTFQKTMNQNSYTSSLSEDDELEAIFTRTYGKIERKTARQLGYRQSEHQHVEIKKQKPRCLLVDGYNVIHAWDELKVLANDNLEGARLRLLDMMCNYQGYKDCLLIVVFDAYKVKGNIGSHQQYHNIHVVYTKEAQTADMYIERATHQMAEDYQVTVATSDALEQLIVAGAGAYRMSSRELRIDLDYVSQMTQHNYQEQSSKNHNCLLEDVKNYKKN